jgi:gliding motility-associated-like protein
LVAYNPLACNGVDSITRTVTIKSKPTADFTYAPITPIPNEPIQFTNQSVGADRYLWQLGVPNATSTAVSPNFLYPATGTFNVCLVAYNEVGCTDTICKPIKAEIERIMDVPNAFSPNGDGNNDILFVRGAAILTMNFKVYNRWGQKVFESGSLEYGWDGNFNGQPAPTEGYAYLLEVTFTDGVTGQKKGNVTLLR